MRKLTITCDLCSRDLALERGKEILFETGKNTYHVVDACPECLDDQLRVAESVNDTGGFRQRVAVLLKLPGNALPNAQPA